ncbi:hypothetical protein B0T19DRAFT_90545 [Cercophora scortea]|uniref:Arrestin C-terminal-like domain-containing protein n=1 Tax=Cercophora scortea TaxID=314031 RepID=A0AAE0IVN0_9PEZI|nr:hypothetical protein B0T19DRAFT_90545 [Cercophora scortea]
MPSFNPFASGKHASTLFEIRLDDDFIVLRGSEHESSGQLLKGTVVLCLISPLKIEDVHLRLTGTMQKGWIDSRVTTTGVSNHKVDKVTQIFSHRWAPFAGVGASDTPGSAASQTRGTILNAGNYEWPFELMLSGDMTESIEGLREANITYKLKATVARGMLSPDLHAYKRLRIIRTLESSALEFLHAMSVENIWPNKVEYSIVVPQKAVVFGSNIPLETRFTPLLKGLDLGDITIKLIEVHDIVLQSPMGHNLREHRKEKEVMMWTIPMNRDEHWQDMIEDTGQEGWVMRTTLDLPRKLGKCVQDVNTHGIKVRHKLKLVVALKNPDGHISELRATLPVTIFISPNMPLDDEGNLLQQDPLSTPAQEVNSIAPPGYGEHVLDQLYQDMEDTGMQTPACHSGMSTPFYGHSRAGSAENLASLAGSMTITPAALSSRLQSVSMDPAHRNHSWGSLNGAAMASGGSGGVTPLHQADSVHGHAHVHNSPPHTAPLSRRDSEEQQSSGSNTPEHIEIPELAVLSKVPSYQTAVKSPIRTVSLSEHCTLPDYRTATSGPLSAPTSAPTSAPGSPVQSHAELTPMEIIAETDAPQAHAPRDRRPTVRRGFSLSHALHHHSDSGDERRRSHQLQARERVA